MLTRWIRYKLFYENEAVYGNEDWCYFLLPIDYPKDWRRTFTDYITDRGIYTCELEEVNIKNVPYNTLNHERKLINLKIQNAQREIDRYKLQLEGICLYL